MRIIVVDDQPYKISTIVSFLNREHPTFEIYEARSYASALIAMLDADFDFAILDLELPSTDPTEHDTGGRVRKLGGCEIVRKLQRSNKMVHFAILTQYDCIEYENEIFTLEKIRSQTKEMCGNYFHGLFLYDSVDMIWQQNIMISINEVVSNAKKNTDC